MHIISAWKKIIPRTQGKVLAVWERKYMYLVYTCNTKIAFCLKYLKKMWVGDTKSSPLPSPVQYVSCHN